MGMKEARPMQLGVIGQRHHTPIFNALSKPIAKARGKKFPSTETALLGIGCERALKGDKKAIKRTLGQLKTHELKKVRLLNKTPEVLSLYENENFERVDEALDILKLRVETHYKWEQQFSDDTANDTGHRRKWMELERTGDGVPDWLIEAARERPGCSRKTIHLVRQWIREGGQGPMRHRDVGTSWNRDGREEYVPLPRVKL